MTFKISILGKSIENVTKCCNLLTLSSRRYVNDVAFVHQSIYRWIEYSEYLAKDNSIS